MQASGPQNQFVLFKIGPETYAVDIAETQEVLRYRVPKKIPHSPRHVLGVINLRGQIIPIIGLREKFALESQEASAETRIIVCHNEGKLTGVVCDAVERVVFIPAKNIEDNPEFAEQSAKSAIRGVAHIDDEESVIFLLNLAILTQEDDSRETAP